MKTKTVRLNFRELDLYAKWMHRWLPEPGVNPLTIEVPGYEQEELEALYKKLKNLAHMPRP